VVFKERLDIRSRLDLQVQLRKQVGNLFQPGEVLVISDDAVEVGVVGDDD
jgi:hypothetical protein